MIPDEISAFSERSDSSKAMAATQRFTFAILEKIIMSFFLLMCIFPGSMRPDSDEVPGDRVLGTAPTPVQQRYCGGTRQDVI